MESTTSWGRAAKLIRIHRGLTQAKLSEMTGVHASHISYLETGRRSPSVELLDSLCKALQIRISEFAKIAEDPDAALGIRPVEKMATYTGEISSLTVWREIDEALTAEFKENEQ